jgi:hypothetical protein
MAKNLHHDGVEAHHEEIELREIDKILHDRWNSPQVLAVYYLVKGIDEVTDMLIYGVFRILCVFFRGAAKRLEQQSMIVKPDFFDQFESVTGIDFDGDGTVGMHPRMSAAMSNRSLHKARRMSHF